MVVVHEDDPKGESVGANAGFHRNVTKLPVPLVLEDGNSAFESDNDILSAIVVVVADGAT
jgi:hypothetical protein